MCKHCGRDKPAFDPKRHGTTCADCLREQNRQSRERRKHIPESAALNVARRARAKESGAARLSSQAWRAANRARVNNRLRERRKERRVNDPVWVSRERLRNRVSDFMRRGGRVRDFSVRELSDFVRQQDGRCANRECAADLSLGYHIDHVTPLSRGGSNDLGNLQLLCPSCNLRKGSKTMAEWLLKDAA
jgi:5-methylcytosine-specific restriction endonuclease McrA